MSRTRIWSPKPRFGVAAEAARIGMIVDVDGQAVQGSSDERTVDVAGLQLSPNERCPATG